MTLTCPLDGEEEPCGTFQGVFSLKCHITHLHGESKYQKLELVYQIILYLGFHMTSFAEGGGGGDRWGIKPPMHFFTLIIIIIIIIIT